MEQKAVKAQVFGVVQGVGYRYFVRRQAQRLGLQGYVRNRRDGSVEVVAQGTQKAVKQLLSYCQQGPVGSQVQRIEKQEADFNPSLQRFVIAN